MLVTAEDNHILSRTLQRYILCRVEQTLRECHAANIPIPENPLLLSNCFEFRYREEEKLDLELRLPDYFDAKGDTPWDRQHRHAFLDWVRTAYSKSNADAQIDDFPDAGREHTFGEQEMAEVDKSLRSILQCVKNTEQEIRVTK